MIQPLSHLVNLDYAKTFMQTAIGATPLVNWVDPQQDPTPIPSGVRTYKGRILITCDGMEKSLKEWSEYTGIKKNTLYYRLRAGWNIEDVLYTPVRGKKKPGMTDIELVKVFLDALT